MSRTIFWDVDTQADFLEPAGKLYVPSAENIVPRLRQLTEFAAAHHILIISSACAHLPSDPEFSEYPPHCLVGTPGQKKAPETLLANRFTIPNRKIELPDLTSYSQVIIEKQATDVFTNPNTEDVLNKVTAALGEAPSSVEIVLYGVVTEICVDLAARGLLRRRYRVTLLRDAVQHLSPELGDATASYVQQHGGAVSTSAEVLSRLMVPSAST